MAIKVVAWRCPQNHRCPAIRSCPAEALKQEGRSAPTVDQELCIDCGECVQVCPMGALQYPETVAARA